MLRVMYREWASRRVPGAAAWIRSVAPPGDAHRVVPDGCMDLIWVSGELLVAGPDTAAYVATGPPGVEYAALRFPPGLAPAVLGVPAAEVRDRRVPLAALWRPAEVRRLTDRLAAGGQPAGPGQAAGGPARAAGGPAAAAAALEEAAAARLAAAGGPDPWAARLVGWLREGRTVRSAADRSGLSERQLHRRCLPLFGYGPKTLGRVLRFDRALALARAGRPFAEVAVEAGYADQAHLSREVRALAGVPLRRLV
jgi:AraC-like DNA-binding protein